MDVTDDDISFWALCLEGESDPKEVFREMKTRGWKAMMVQYEFMQMSGPNIRVIDLDADEGALDQKKCDDDLSCAYELIERVISKLIDTHFPRSDCEDLDWFATVKFTEDSKVVADVRGVQLVHVANDMLLL